MSDAEQSSVRIDQTETRSMWPFLVAAGIIVVVLLGIVIATVVSPAEKNVTETDRLAVAARNFAESRSGTADPDPSQACPGFDEKRSPLYFPDETGRTFVFSKLTDAVFDADKASARVTYTADGKAATGTWHFRKTGSTWLVCN